jgi:ADP-heptose:LPS heptosyltransferase
MPVKVLIIQTAFIGDVVLATSLVENIHTAFPGVILISGAYWYGIRRTKKSGIFLTCCAL